MQSSYTGHIAASEWRWVTLVGIGLVALVFLPFLWVVLTSSPDADWQFMGALHHHIDAAAYLSRIQQGSEGNWLMHFQHTSESHASAIIQPLYPLIGQITRVTFQVIPSIIAFHIARVAATLFMYVALYHLSAMIWMRVRTRRIFFILASVSSGLGWLFILISGGANGFIDLSTPYLSPFHSSLVNVHYPLTFACLALLAAIIIPAFRPGMQDNPGVHNGGVGGFLLSIILVFVFPEAFIPLGMAVLGSILFHWYKRKQITMREARWGIWIVLPTFPLLAYYVITLQTNPAVLSWVQQKASSPPSPVMMILALGIPLGIAVPAIYRAIRRMESDGDRFMLLWFVAMIVMVYMPLDIRLLSATGIMIPVIYFATRALEDFWFQYMERRWRYRLFVGSLPVLGFSHLYVLFFAVQPLFVGQVGNLNGMVLEPDYRAAFEWLANRVDSREVILASPDVSAWIPYWTGARVVYGHPAETLDAFEKRQSVEDWYGNRIDCEFPLAGQAAVIGKYGVDYVLVGPRELQLGDSSCVDNLTFVAMIGRVNIYATDSPVSP